MFGLSVATEIFQGSTTRTWNCVSYFVHLIWTKLNHIRQPIMPKSRKRHHSRSRSRSRSHSRDRSHEREDKHRKNDSHEKDRDGKRRKIESYDSPPHKRSVSSEPETLISEDPPTTDVRDVPSQENEVHSCTDTKTGNMQKDDEKEAVLTPEIIENTTETNKNEIEGNKNDESKNTNDEKVSLASPVSGSKEQPTNKLDSACRKTEDIEETDMQNEDIEVKSSDNKNAKSETSKESVIVLDESNDDINTSVEGLTLSKKNELEITPKKVLSPKQVQKKLESEKKRKEKQLEKEEKERKRNEEKERLKQEKLQKKKEKELKEEQKRKEREEKEEQKRKEREEKEQKKKEKEEREEQKRKEREQEKLKRQLEIEEKNKEKQKEEEKKQKAAAAFVNFFVSKKADGIQEDKKSYTTQPYAFKAFEVKSDMKLPPPRRQPLSEKEKGALEFCIKNQDDSTSYINDLKSGKSRGRSYKTWPFEETVDDDIAIVEDSNLGETICEDTSKFQRLRAKFLKFHENRRPAYFGTWRKKSKCVTPRKPFAEDVEIFNYEEDSDDDWEEEEQGESLENGSDDEADKENDEEKDDYEVDNDFFVPHGHLSDDEVDDEENARLSPESLKQKLKLLKDEFEEDMQSKMHKLKPRSIGCIWLNKDGKYADEAILKSLQPFAMITNGTVQVGKRADIFTATVSKRHKPTKELDPEHIPLFLKAIHGNVNKKTVLVEQFMTQMGNNGFNIDVKKTTLIRSLKNFATWKKCKVNGPLKNKCCWLVNDDVAKKYAVDLSLSYPNNLASSSKERSVTETIVKD